MVIFVDYSTADICFLPFKKQRFRFSSLVNRDAFFFVIVIRPMADSTSLERAAAAAV